MKNKIMILGAGVYQVPLIKAARTMGLETVVVSPRRNYPGIPLADIFFDIDTTDTARIVAAAKEIGISGIATTGTDVCIPSLGMVVDSLNLAGTGYAAACRSSNKILMKKALVEKKVPTAPFAIFDQLSSASDFGSQIGYPVMVKAVDSSGSRGVTKVSAAAEFAPAWARAVGVSRSKEIIVEKFLEGEEYGAQAFVHGAEVVAIFHHGDTVTPAPYFSPIGHSMPSRLSASQQRESSRVIETAIRAIGLRDCVCNVDMTLADGKPQVIELAARMGATCLPECVSIHSGTDVYEHLVSLAMGQRPCAPSARVQATACLLLRSPETGVVASLDIPEEVKEHPDLVEIQWDVAIGDPVKKFVVGPDRIGHLLVKAANAASAESLVQTFADKIRIGVQGGEASERRS